MNQLLYMNPQALFLFLFRQTSLQQQVIELQQQVIELQSRIEKLTPPNPPDEEVFWHVASDGLMSSEAATSNDLATVRRFRKWNVDFAKKHIKPYVNPKVYSECVSQMTRGLPERIAELETGKKPECSVASSVKVSAAATQPLPEKTTQLAFYQ